MENPGGVDSVSSKINIFTYWQKKGDRVLVGLFVLGMGYCYVAQADASKTKYYPDHLGMQAVFPLPCLFSARREREGEGEKIPTQLCFYVYGNDSLASKLSNQIVVLLYSQLGY